MLTSHSLAGMPSPTFLYVAWAAGPTISEI